MMDEENKLWKVDTEKNFLGVGGGQLRLLRAAFMDRHFKYSTGFPCANFLKASLQVRYTYLIITVLETLNYN